MLRRSARAFPPTMLKSLAKRMLPAPAIAFVRLCRQRGLLVAASLSWRQRALRKAFEAGNRNVPADQIEIRPGLRFKVNKEARGGFEYFAFRDAEMCDELDGFLRLSRGRKVLWDIGALHGIFSMAFCGENHGKALAFEPSPVATPVLRDNLARNSDLSIRHLCCAVGEERGKARFELFWHHACALGEGESGAPGQVIEVDVVTLDELLSKEEPPDTIKIDVEGYEFRVLKGARRVLGEFHPLVFLEIHPEVLGRWGTAIAEIYAFLEGFGYAIVDPSGSPVSAAAVARDGLVRRVVCLPPG